MKWRPVLAGIAFLFGVAALVGGCLAVLRLPFDDYEPGRIKAAGSLQVLIDAEPESGDYTGVGFGPARVAIVGDGCLGFNINGTQIVVAWPYGSKATGADREVTVTTPVVNVRDEYGDPLPSEGGVEVKAGDFVSGGRPAYGKRWGHPARKFDDWADDLSPGCLTLPLWRVDEIEIGPPPRDKR